MCGIVGYVGQQEAAPILLDGLRRLEYRGYDSAGIAVCGDGQLRVKKSRGRLQVLSDLTHDGADLPGHLGIGHTRWATHGEPNDINAHPHVSQSGRIAVVHNGIIENYAELKEQLLHKGYYAKYSFDDVIGQSAAIRRTKETLTRMANSESPILLIGETGTGKELIVNAIQKTSRRKDAPFIKQNCASIPSTLLESILFGTTKGSYTGAKDTPGLFELADGGTLFLDEINSMELTAQAKLLRVLEDNCIRRIGAKEEKQVNVRIIAAVNEDPEGCVERNKIREDIFYRLCVLRYDIPELYRRKGDIPLLMEYFRKHYNKKFHKQIMAYSSEVQDIFLAYNWPGNVRELKNVIESAFHNNHTAILTRNDIPNYILSRLAVDTMHAEDVRGLPLHEMLARYEVLLIEDAYRRNGGSLTKTAAELQVSKQNLAYKMKKYDIR